MKSATGFLCVLAAIVVACGGDSDGGGQTATASSSEPSITTNGALPDACSLVSDGDAGAALGAGAIAGVAPQPPTDVASRCDWTSGQYTLSLLVRRGANAKSSFDNAVDGFAETTVGGADARIQLGARETARNYRFVALSTWDGTHYVYFSLQGSDRDDAAADEVVTTLAGKVFEALR